MNLSRDYPSFELVDETPPYCGDCGHFHLGGCVHAVNTNCGSYLCCQPGSGDCPGCGAEIALDCTCDE